MSTPPPRVRPAGVTDLEEIMVLESSIFASDAWSAASMKRELQNPNCVYLVADRPTDAGAPKVVAYAGLHAPRGSGQAEIQTIAVVPSERRSGLATALIESLSATALARGAEELFLEVRADNAGAQNLYRRLGFEEIGVRPHYYQPDGVDALVMQRHLPEPHPERRSELHGEER